MCTPVVQRKVVPVKVEKIETEQNNKQIKKSEIIIHTLDEIKKEKISPLVRFTRGRAKIQQQKESTNLV